MGLLLRLNELIALNALTGCLRVGEEGKMAVRPYSVRSIDAGTKLEFFIKVGLRNVLQVLPNQIGLIQKDVLINSLSASISYVKL